MNYDERQQKAAVVISSTLSVSFSLIHCSESILWAVMLIFSRWHIFSACVFVCVSGNYTNIKRRPRTRRRRQLMPRRGTSLWRRKPRVSCQQSCSLNTTSLRWDRQTFLDCSMCSPKDELTTSSFSCKQTDSSKFEAHSQHSTITPHTLHSPACIW